MKNQSTSLDEVKRFILANFDLSEILAIILVGSYAKGRERKASDIDIIIFKKNQPSVIERQEIRFHEYELDIRLYRQAYFEETFQKKATCL